MRPVSYARATDTAQAIAFVGGDAHAEFIAGGTNVIDLMKDDVARPSTLVDITRLPLGGITPAATSVRIGALARMSEVADHPAMQTNFPAVVQALNESASPQLRNMATIGGNVMQRTRCTYFRDVSQPCNKRAPGAGCAAIGGVNRMHSVIGTSTHCICAHASDLAVALLMADAIVHTRGAQGERAIPLAGFYLLPGSTPERETVLERGELIEAIEIPVSTAARRSVYLKVRDRRQYEFALVSVAAGLDIQGGIIRAARVALGGVAPKPWRAHDVEAQLIGKPANDRTFAAAAAYASTGMRGFGENDFKVPLSDRAVARALSMAEAVA
jgi:xanthine dehydrogenase YagS FAD-binding subunit